MSNLESTVLTSETEARQGRFLQLEKEKESGSRPPDAERPGYHEHGSATPFFVSACFNSFYSDLICCEGTNCCLHDFHKDEVDGERMCASDCIRRSCI